VEATAGWVQFRRSDLTAVINLVRTAAETADAGEHGDGVEVVIEAPRLRWFARLFRDWTPDQARIVVTRSGGEVAYPFSIQLVSEHRGRAARRVHPSPGWATSNSAGLAFLIQKGRPDAPADWDALVGGAMGALSNLTRKLPDRGWRVMIDRAVKRV
jgi:hypothetical protein